MLFLAFLVSTVNMDRINIFYHHNITYSLTYELPYIIHQGVNNEGISFFLSQHHNVSHASPCSPLYFLLLGLSSNWLVYYKLACRLQIGL